MKSKYCCVQLNDSGHVIRICKRLTVNCSLWLRKDAVRAIRITVFNRSGGECEKCGERITWDTGEMDERVSKGEGGEVSVDNCWMLCHSCHQGSPFSEHGERRWGGRKEL